MFSGEYFFVKNVWILRPCDSLRKHAYSNILKVLPPKNENFQMKNSDNFHISAQNKDCGRDKKNNVYPCKPQFYYIKVGFKGVKII